MLGSQTEKVLQHATIPVLVAAVESNLSDAGALGPLAVIRDEHRSMAAVLHGFEYLVREAREAGVPPSFSLLRAMLHWVKAYPEALHHPKEEAYLFPRLRARTHDVDATLDELERQHVRGPRARQGPRGPRSSPTRPTRRADCRTSRRRSSVSRQHADPAHAR